jgi:cubilin
MPKRRHLHQHPRLLPVPSLTFCFRENCVKGMFCSIKNHNFRCQCPPAWHGIHCTSQKDDCTGSSNLEICGHGTCLTLPRTSHNESSFSCLCDAGWTKNVLANSPCDIDVDECTVSKPPCSTDPQVNCINTPGSFRYQSINQSINREIDH